MANTFNNITYWNTQENFKYPETDPGSPFKYEAIMTRPNSGICISGGGSVSASLIAGYFAALSELNLIDSLRYISGVSGGTWGSAPFIYLPEENTNFSGTTNMPADISLLEIEVTKDGSMQHAAAHADIVDKSVVYLAEAAANHTPTNRVYEKAVGSLFLNAFNIPSPTAKEADAKFFSTNEAMVANIKQRNPGLKNDFMKMAKDRPFLIMNTTMFIPMLGKEGDDTQKNYYYICPFEVTPLYSGIKAPQLASGNLAIGGVFVETFGFNTTLTGTEGGVAQATGDLPFELCQPVGSSGAALEMLLENKYPELLGCFPQFNYWNPLAPDQGTQQYNFGDGGCIEDTGITALLARGVQNIAAFLTEPVYFPEHPQADPSSKNFGEMAFGYNQIAALFGEALIDTKTSKKENKIVWLPANNVKQVFDNTNKDNNFKALVKALYDAKTEKGGPLVVNMKMNVIPNNVFGITASYQPHVIWSVVDTCTTWTGELGWAVKEWMKHYPTMSDFPEVKVFGQNFGDIIKLTPGQTNQLANLGYWMVKSKASTFTSVLTGAAVPAEENKAMA